MIISFFGFYVAKNKLLLYILPEKVKDKDNELPISEYHKGEFNVKNSNYLEKNYSRYIEYKKNNSKYSDDQIITYVNIGLDNSYYTNVRNSNYSDGFLILCNKYNHLDSDYVPKLVTVPSKYADANIYLIEEAYNAFKLLADDARKIGYDIVIESGYRSYGLQKRIYNGRVSSKGVAGADLSTARPGYSEHQTGLAMDVRTKDGSYTSFGTTKAYSWMISNCYKYGLTLRYPASKEWITGYKNEPWHYRYVGLEVATYIHNNNVTYEEYYATFMES